MDFWGTRKDGDPTVNAPPWDKLIFREVAFGPKSEEDNIRVGLHHWRGAKNRPQTGTATVIANELFGRPGQNPVFEAWRDDLEQAWQRSEGQGNNMRTRTYPDPPAPGSISLVPSFGKTIPRLTPHFLGRSNEVKKLADAITSNETSAILVHGGPGVGKTELTKAVAHDKAVIERFGDRRWFVSLQMAQSAVAMQRAIMQAIGADSSAGFEAALDQLRGMQTLLILDNLETPWEGAQERRETEAVLLDLHAIDGVYLLASFRGIEIIGDIQWAPYPLEGLTRTSAIELFAAIAGKWVLDDPHLSDFVKALGGIPLAIDLVARRAFGRSKLTSLWREWQKIGADFAKRNDAVDGPLTSLPYSIELSLKSPRIKDNNAALRLFSFLGQLPAGLTNEDCEQLIGELSFAAEESLIKAGIAFEQLERINLLSPIREHSRRYYPPNVEDHNLWISQFLGRARTYGGHIKNLRGNEVVNASISDFENITASVFSSIYNNGNINIIDELGDYIQIAFNLGFGDNDLMSLIDNIEKNSNKSDDTIVATLYKLKSFILGKSSEYELSLQFAHKASIIFSGKELYQDLFACLYQISMCYSRLSRFEEALQYINFSCELNEKFECKDGMAKFELLKCEIYLNCGHVDEAEATILKYLNVNKNFVEFDDIKVTLGIYACLAKIYGVKNNHSLQILYLMKCLNIFEVSGWKSLEADTCVELSRAYCDSGDCESALKYAYIALNAYVLLKDEPGINDANYIIEYLNKTSASALD